MPRQQCSSGFEPGSDRREPLRRCGWLRAGCRWRVDPEHCIARPHHQTVPAPKGQCPCFRRWDGWAGARRQAPRGARSSAEAVTTSYLGRDCDQVRALMTWRPRAATRVSSPGDGGDSRSGRLGRKKPVAGTRPPEGATGSEGSRRVNAAPGDQGRLRRRRPISTHHPEKAAKRTNGQAMLRRQPLPGGPRQRLAPHSPLARRGLGQQHLERGEAISGSVICRRDIPCRHKSNRQGHEGKRGNSPLTSANGPRAVARPQAQPTGHLDTAHRPPVATAAPEFSPKRLMAPATASSRNSTLPISAQGCAIRCGKTRSA